MLLVEVGLGAFEHARATGHADELILRHRLANDLRRRLRLADGSLHPSLGYMRATVLRPLAACERRALLDEYPLVSSLADRVERGPVGPRALVLLWSVVSAPPLYSATSEREAGDEVRRRHHEACGHIDRHEHREDGSASGDHADVIEGAAGVAAGIRA